MGCASGVVDNGAEVSIVEANSNLSWVRCIL